MLRRFSSRRAGLYETFLRPRLAGATSYDRIAGYFQSSLLELANEPLAAIPRIRIVCNTEVSAEDVKTVRMATGARRKELENGLLRLAWNAGHFPHLVEVHGGPAQHRLKVLHDLLIASGQEGRLFEIRLVPDAEFGFVHGKGGVIEGSWGKTSFIGSANDSSRAWTKRSLSMSAHGRKDPRPSRCWRRCPPRPSCSASGITRNTSSTWPSKST
jgi:phosphatidylserine/phosphatidylglycerophosphate/cardiolipin synthase-like enzyme